MALLVRSEIRFFFSISQIIWLSQWNIKGTYKVKLVYEICIFLPSFENILLM